MPAIDSVGLECYGFLVGIGAAYAFLAEAFSQADRSSGLSILYSCR